MCVCTLARCLLCKLSWKATGRDPNEYLAVCVSVSEWVYFDVCSYMHGL